VPGASGPGIYDGDITIDGPPSPYLIAQLEGFTCVTGRIGIYGALPDLTFLSSIQAIGGDLDVAYSSLAALDGLENLRFIRGDLYINTTSVTDVDALHALRYVGGILWISENVQLTDLGGLAQLESVGAGDEHPGAPYFEISDNPQLPACWVSLLANHWNFACGYGSGQCDGNSGSGTCTLLPPGFVCEPGASGPGVFDGDVWIGSSGPLATVSGDNGELIVQFTDREVAGLECITGGLYVGVQQDPSLPSFQIKAVAGVLDISFNQLSSLAGFEEISTVGSLNIYANDNLRSLQGLEGLEEVTTGEIQIAENALLDACWVPIIEAQVGQTCGPDACFDNAGTDGCAAPSNTCYPGASGPLIYDGSLFVSGANAAAAVAAIAGYECVTGSVEIYDSDIADLSPLSSLREIGGRLRLGSNSSLTSVNGLQQLQYVGETLYINNNPNLTNLRGLASLTSLGGGSYSSDLFIYANASLPACWVETMEDQLGRACVYDPWGEMCDYNNGVGDCDDLVTSFTTIAELASYASRARAVSGDGSTVVGYQVEHSGSPNLIVDAFRYDAVDGFSLLERGLPDPSYTTAVDVSDDGQVILGRSSSSGAGVTNTAVLWNALGEITHTSLGSVATWLAPDASFALGYVSSSPTSPHRFNDSLVVTASIARDWQYLRYEATAGSDDGNTLLVSRQSAGSADWESILCFGPLLDSCNLIPHRAGSTSQYFADMTPDGSVLVGQALPFYSSQAVTWSIANGYTTIPGLGSCSNSDAVRVAQRSAGLRVVGHCDDNAYVWDENGQTRLLADALTQLGISTPADVQLHVEAISSDGSTLVGYSYHYATQMERAFIVRLGEDYAALP
jgi:uncharacterized membrane protein